MNLINTLSREKLDEIDLIFNFKLYSIINKGYFFGKLICG